MSPEPQKSLYNIFHCLDYCIIRDMRYNLCEKPSSLLLFSNTISLNNSKCQNSTCATHVSHLVTLITSTCTLVLYPGFESLTWSIRNQVIHIPVYMIHDHLCAVVSWFPNISATLITGNRKWERQCNWWCALLSQTFLSFSCVDHHYIILFYWPTT